MFIFNQNAKPVALSIALSIGTQNQPANQRILSIESQSIGSNARQGAPRLQANRPQVVPTRYVEYPNAA